jgi:hypothetical protein
MISSASAMSARGIDRFRSEAPLSWLREVGCHSDVQQRPVPVRPFYDHLVEECV